MNLDIEIDLEKDDGGKNFIFCFNEPCRIKKLYNKWPRNEVEREKRILSIPSDFIYHPLPTSDNSIELYAPFFLTLSNLLTKNRYDERIFQRYLYSWVLQASKAISDIHSNKLYHGRISNESFYVNENMILGLGNTGYTSGRISYNNHMYYTPPEGFPTEFNFENLSLEQKQQYDVYSLGLLMTEILTLNPYSENEDKTLDYERLKSRDINFFKQKVKSHIEQLHENEPEFEKIINKCIDNDPTKRIKAIELFNDLQNLISQKKYQYAINSLQNVKQPLNVFESMKIIPQNISINSQIINKIINSCGYEYVLDVIANEKSLFDSIFFSIPDSLITYTIDNTKFNTFYENGRFINYSHSQALADQPLTNIFSMTLEDLFMYKDFLPTADEIASWILILNFYITLMIKQKTKVCELSLRSIFIFFSESNFEQVHIDLYPLGETVEDDQLYFNWFIQYGKIIEKIVQLSQEKLNKFINKDKANVSVSQLDKMISNNSNLQNLIWACLNINSEINTIEINDNNNDTDDQFDRNQYLRLTNQERYNVITKLLSDIIKDSAEPRLVLNRVSETTQQEPLNLLSILAWLDFYSKKSESSILSYTKNQIDLMRNLTYAFLDYFLPEECKLEDIDQMIHPFHILCSFYKILYDYKVETFVSKEVDRVERAVIEMKRQNPIIQELNLTGLQFSFFRQYMITMIPKIFTDNNHELVITVNSFDDDSESDQNSIRIVNIQDVIDYAQEMDIEYDQLDDNTISLHFYKY